MEISDTSKVPSIPPGGDTTLGGTAPAKRIGELLVEENLITPAQLDAALRAQGQLTKYAPLGHILVSQGAITRQGLARALARHKKRSSLGELLVRARVITKEQLDIALQRQRENGLRLGEILVKLQYLSEESLRQALATQLNVKSFDLDHILLDPGTAKYVNASYAAHHLVVPLARAGNTLVVAMDDPADVGVVEELEMSSGLRVEVVTGTRAGIGRAYARIYGVGHALAGTVAAETMVTSDRPGSQAAAEGLLRQLLHSAIANCASDIHLELRGHGVQVRFRIDGVLQGVNLGALQDAIDRSRSELVSHVKILSKLDIAERRRPQDGSFRVRTEREGERTSIDLRVSIIPGYYGENVVIRILDPRHAPPSVEALGFGDTLTRQWLGLLRRPAGLLLVTGPTGSGKSSTLFASLKSVYRPEIKILTAENPIEHVSEHFCQHEVNERAGNTFASYLRAFLRHDPEVIMVGEIRDAETARLAIGAAQTGHLVLSTLHTNDAVSAVTRLLDLGVDANLIASSLSGVLAQRLVRRICADCRQEAAPSPELVREVCGDDTGLRWYRGSGCPACRFTGYRGRLPVAELWTPSDLDVLLISRTAPFAEIQASARRSTVPMAEHILEKLREGQTSLEEIIRTVPYESLRHLRACTPAPSPRSSTHERPSEDARPWDAALMGSALSRMS